MTTRIHLALAAALLACALPAGAATTAASASASATTTAAAVLPDSAQIEKDLQRLPWPRFRTVIEAIPKMKAEVDAYGPMGWDYVRAHYRTHHWKKNVDRLDAAQRRQLVDLIRNAQAPR